MSRPKGYRHTEATKAKLRERKIGDKNPQWKGGRFFDNKNERWWIYKPQHPSANFRGYVQEHRLVVESKIGRFLRKNEIVHHIDENKLNNAPENLRVMTQSEHLSLHRRKEFFCSIKNCMKKHRARKMCVYHYNQWLIERGGYV